MSTVDPREWMPIRVYVEDGVPMVDWCHVGARRPTEPFFTDFVEKRLRDPFALVFRHQTRLDDLVALCDAAPGLPPAGFIFHMSRCGSTLVAQMLAQLDENLVLSEPGPLESLLRLRLHAGGVPERRWMAWLRAIVAAMAQPRCGGERRVIVKLDTWAVLALPMLRRAFPEVPWIFLHRDPVEVLVSHQRSTAAAMVPGAFPPQLFGVGIGELGTLSREAYQARVLGSLCEAAAERLHDGGLAVAYEELPDAVPTSIAAHFGLSLQAGDVQRMAAVSGLDAKRPGRPFSADSMAKQLEAPPTLRQAAERWATPAWTRLQPERQPAALVGG
jgi:hypothetical protein